MIKKAILTVAAVVTLVVLYGGWTLQREADRVMSDDPTVWEPVIRQFEARDREAMPPEGQVLLLGSSSIRFWGENISADLSSIGAFGRGFGGAKIDDITHYADRLIKPYAPRAVVLYIGANDISGALGASYISNDEAERRYRVMLDVVRDAAGDVPVYLIAIKPTLRSAERWPVIEAFNECLAVIATEDPQLHYLDANTLLWNEQGEPRSDALMFDGMHLSRKGYELWGNKIRERLIADGFARQ